MKISPGHLGFESNLEWNLINNKKFPRVKNQKVRKMKRNEDSIPRNIQTGSFPIFIFVTVWIFNARIFKEWRILINRCKDWISGIKILAN